MTAKTLEKVPVHLGGFVHPAAESVYPVDDMGSSLQTSVAIFPNGDLGAHYDQINMAGKITDFGAKAIKDIFIKAFMCVSIIVKKKIFILKMLFCISIHYKKICPICFLYKGNKTIFRA